MIEEQKLIKHYTAIAEKIDEIIPVEWDRVGLYGVETGDTSIVSFYYFIGDRHYYSNSIPEDCQVDEKIFRTLRGELIQCIKDLWYEFKAAGEATWRTLTFKLDKDWNYEAKYDYTVDYFDDYSKEIRWAYDELEIVPDGDYGQKLLNEYFEEIKTKESNE